MDIDKLWVIETAAHQTDLTLSPITADIKIPTCQRTLYLSFNPMLWNDQGVQRVFTGEVAYEFLLRFAAGLESEVKGEADVFGQVKTAFKNEQRSEWNQFAQKWFEDVKEIRAHYLQNIGASTYGGLARKLVHLRDQDHVVIFGAGQMAKSVVPYFLESSVVVWNRSEDRLCTLRDYVAQHVRSAEQKSVRWVSAKPELAVSHLIEDLIKAKVFIFTTPPKSAIESEIMGLFDPLSAGIRTIVHLGGRKRDLDEKWYQGHRLFTLDDVFALEKQGQDSRVQQLSYALAACQDRARLRKLSMKGFLAHGWEDLALFS